MRNRVRWRRALFVLLSAVIQSVVLGGGICQGHWVNPATDICWSCLFPLTIGGVSVSGSALPDTDNGGSPICQCGWNLPGVTVGYWEPMGLVDITKTPFCLVSLGGTSVSSDPTAAGMSDSVSTTQNSSYYYTHYLNYPILQMVDSGLLGGSCQTDGDFFGSPYFSELDPTAKNETYAALVFPETAIFNNPATVLGTEALCAADSLKANTGLPSDSAFFCAGSQGFMYPMSGTVDESVSLAQASTLLAERTLYKLHRLSQIKDTNASDACHEQTLIQLPKSRYRYQMDYPKQGACEPFGRTSVLWESGQFSPASNPTESEDSSYVIWRKRNCCSW
jgi:conjugal transfer pilus assembly protein TraU